MKIREYVFLFVVWTQALLAQPATLWERSYGGANIEDGHVIEQTPDGGFIIGGLTTSTGAGGMDMWLLRLAENGDSLWSRTFGGVEDEICYGLATTIDGYLLCGPTTSFGQGSEDLLLIKVNLNGGSLWSRTYGGLGNERGNTVLRTEDGGFLIGIERLENGLVADVGLSVLKIDSTGDSLWSLSLGGDVLTITFTSDGNYVAAGYVGTEWPGDADMWMAKFSPSGDLLWTQAFTDCGDQCQSIQETPNGFALMGYSKIGCGPEQYWLTLTDHDGQPLESHPYGGGSYDYCYGGLLASDGGFVMNGYTWSFGNGQRDMWLVKTDSEGNLLWSQTYGGFEDDLGEGVKELPNREYVLVGKTRSFGSGNLDVYVVKLGSDDSILPVELLFFEAIPGIESIALRWSTASESSLSHFEIARNGISVAHIPASNISTGHAYSWEDVNVNLDENYQHSLTSVDLDGSRALLGTVNARVNRTSLPSQFGLLQNYPNPFNTSTAIEFSLSENSYATLKVYNLLGETIATLVHGQLSAGFHQVAFDASGFTSGIYSFELTDGLKQVSQKKMVLIK